MKDKIKITANLTKEDVEEIIQQYLSKEGYEISSFNFDLGYDDPSSEPYKKYFYFKGVDCQLKKKSSCGSSYLRDY
jgi:hypothetical protein